MKASDILVCINPNWWGQPPAILKAKAGIVFNTSNTEEQRENVQNRSRQ